MVIDNRKYILLSFLIIAIFAAGLAFNANAERLAPEPAGTPIPEPTAEHYTDFNIPLDGGFYHLADGEVYALYSPGNPDNVQPAVNVVQDGNGDWWVFVARPESGD